MEPLNYFPAILFMLTALVTVYLFYRAARKSFAIIIVTGVIAVFQALLSVSGFYTSSPSRFPVLIAPSLLIVAALCLTGKGNFLNSLDVKTLTIIHLIRIPVEITLLYLYYDGFVPRLMTFEGRNWDIISGITAPAVYYLGFVKRSIGRKTVLLWNVGCLLLLINIVVNAILSAPTRFQQFAFDRPNIALLSFPFAWLPAIVVPIVLLSHIAAIKQLRKRVMESN